MNGSATPTLNWKQICFLSLGVPALFLGLIEITCRIFDIEHLLTPKRASIALEMPTWMQIDANAASRTSSLVAQPEAIDWLNIFEQGNGFRVRLKPGISKRITNTFSQISEDRRTPYLVESNSLGFRGTELRQPKPANSFRIAIFGDSSSFGWGVNQHETFATLLQQDLQRSHPDKTVEIANFAIPGDSSEYGRLLFEAFARDLHADLVILGFGANDAKAAFQAHASQVDRFRSSHTVQSSSYWLKKSALYRTLEAFIGASLSAGKKQQSGKKTKHAVPGKRYQENLLAMAGSATSLGAKDVLLLNLCTPGDYAKRAKKAAQKNGLLYLNGQKLLVSEIEKLKTKSLYPQMVEQMEDLYGHMLRRNQLFYITSDSCHPNAVGHRIIADELATIISPRIR